ncbi:helix-turn-helix transcriptional regulator [Staphylococcus pasteuri]|uniref:helix-turn-helix domain-containing protein n=1 Tax=Staphylococcus pasteuri TaxID=45972 RepID=UPI001E3A3FCA|nr:helix-turn-helix transcriptional regulator [Staphylococcus pasteuri]MCD9066017.1 helix-turn-helix transcriptional regulator [Staphylococcus pasteuri]
MKLSEVLATNLRMLMARDKISVSEMAKETGIARRTITSYRDGRIKMVNLEILNKIADYLDVNVSMLFTKNTHNSSFKDIFKSY